MTKIEVERLAVVEQQVKDIKDDVKELKHNTEKGLDSLNAKMDLFIENSNKSFLTIGQAKLIGWIVSFLLTVSIVAISFLNYIRGH